ncbi:MAG: translation elongation factor Ts [Pirellulales bacterium]
MSEVSAAAVKSLRDRTGLPLMECKKALSDAKGDENAAFEHLRKQGTKIQASRQDRETTEGRIAMYTSLSPGVGAMVELLCESAPVASNDQFVQLANDLAKQLATGPGAATGDELLVQPSPSQPKLTLGAQKDDLFNRIREVFRVGKIVRIDGPCVGYVHHTGKTAVLVQIEGSNVDAARDVAMHVAAMRPRVLTREQLDPQIVAKEREILAEASRKEGKPENIIEKMVEGRMRNFFAENVLVDQPFVKDDKTTVGKFADASGIKLVRYERMQLG